MKRTLIGIASAAVFYGLMILGTRGSWAQEDIPATPPATPPEVTATPTPSEGKATGGVKAMAGKVQVQLTFNAHAPNSPVKGKVNYKASNGNQFKGDVDVCYNQVDNEAAFVGHVTKGNVNSEYFKIEVEDNGEGKHAEPDRIRVLVSENELDCEISGDFPAEVVKGNLQIHK